MPAPRGASTRGDEKGRSNFSRKMEASEINGGGLVWFADNGNADFNTEALRFAECAEDGENGMRFTRYVSR